MWVRGLKRVSLDFTRFSKVVAPYVGAWIETMIAVVLDSVMKVAPYVGAWIETANNGANAGLAYGRTLCGCVD